MEEQSSPTEGGSPVKPAQEILSARDPVSEGNTSPTDLISTQPLPAAAPPPGASRALPGHQPAHNGPDEPTRPQRGPPGRGPPGRGPPGRGPPGRGPSLPVHRNRTGSGRDASDPPATTPSDSCFRLLLACLWCRCSALLLALLEACSSCLHALCSSCCRACARCCAAAREAPVEELDCHAHCHAVLFRSCCEPTECLEFCLECCEICHHS